MTPKEKAFELGVQEITDSHERGYPSSKYRYWAKGFPDDGNPLRIHSPPEAAVEFDEWLEEYEYEHSIYYHAIFESSVPPLKLDKIGWNE